MNYREKLNDEQFAVVTAPEGPVLAIAAAGTGKTHTLTHRVAYLVEEKGVNPNNILLLTFTNKAANELMERASKLLGYPVSLWGGTFHRLANRLLRRHADRIGFRLDFTIMDSDDSKKLVKSCAEEFGLSGKHFPKADVLLGCFGFASGSCKPLADVAADRFADAEMDVSVADVERVHARYVERKRELNSMDFDDMLVFALRLFQEFPDIRDRYSEQFQYVMVDEYQDTNAIQAHWVDLLASRHKNLMVVGDDFQSIYSWRGADFRNIISFPERYEGCTVVKLEQNYRSTPEILDVANKCIEGNPLQFPKVLRAVRPSGSTPRLVKVRDGDEQARFVVDQIKRLIRGGTKPSDIAVLYRAHYHALEMQLELQRAGLDFQVTSGMRFFEQAHIKDICTVLRLLVNPGDELAFTRLLELLPKVGKKTSLKIWNNLGRHFQATQEMAHIELQSSLPKAARPFWDQIKPVFMAFASEDLSNDPGEIVHRFTQDFYHDYMVNGFDNWKSRQEDVDGLVDYCSKFETVESMLSEMALQSNLDTDAVQNSEVNLGEQIRLSTIHQAKGLEWKAVFMLWLSDGMFPSAKTTAEIGGEEEERRLFYVATTRAEDKLFLCTPQVRRKRDGGVIFYDPSRFIQELPIELLDMKAGNMPYSSPYKAPHSTRPKVAPKKVSRLIDVPVVEPEPPRQAEPSKKVMTIRTPIAGFVFSDETAIFTHTLSARDLSDYTGDRTLELSVENELFSRNLNVVRPALERCAGSADISLKVTLKYTPETVDVMRIEATKLNDFMSRNMDVVARGCALELIDGNGAGFVSGDEVRKALPGGMDKIRDLEMVKELRSNGRIIHEDQAVWLAEKHAVGLGSVSFKNKAESAIFVLVGGSSVFFVWEYFDKDLATYIWKSEASIGDMMTNSEIYALEHARAVEEISGMDKRIDYRTSRSGDESFNWVVHTGGFIDWQRRMNEII